MEIYYRQERLQQVLGHAQKPHAKKRGYANAVNRFVCTAEIMKRFLQSIYVCNYTELTGICQEAEKDFLSEKGLETCKKEKTFQEKLQNFLLKNGRERERF